MDKSKIIYWIPTILMCFIFLMSAGMYFMSYDEVAGFFETLGFPTWLVYPLAIAKILGVVAILSDRSRLLSEWAYGGFFFDAALAAAAHLIADDGAHITSFLAIIMTLLSRAFLHKR